MNRSEQIEQAARALLKQWNGFYQHETIDALEAALALPSEDGEKKTMSDANREAFVKALQDYENAVAERAALAEHDIGGGASVGMLRAHLMRLYDALATQHDKLIERSIGAMAIAEGEEGYEKVPVDCPMLGAVSELRSKYNARTAPVVEAMPSDEYFAQCHVTEAEDENGIGVWAVHRKSDDSLEATVCECWSGEQDNEKVARQIADALNARTASAKDAKDAARYRWLREHAVLLDGSVKGLTELKWADDHTNSVISEALDRSIDAVMADAKGTE